MSYRRVSAAERFEAKRADVGDRELCRESDPMRTPDFRACLVPCYAYLCVTRESACSAVREKPSALIITLI